MNKKCLICGNKYSKPSNCSKKDWKTRKYCSISCYRISEKGRKLRQETIDKIQKSRRGYRHSEETKKKIGNANKIANIGKQLGHIVTNETRLKISKANKGRKRPEFSGKNHPLWKGGIENTRMLIKKRRALKRGAEGSHSLNEWNELKKYYNYTCLCCGRKEPEITLTEDHIIPLSRGGSNYITNIQPLCNSCNSKKRVKTIDYRIEFVYA